MYAIGTQNIQKYGKLGSFIGLHNIWVEIASRTAFRNSHEVACAEEVLTGYTGNVIGQSGYVSAKTWLQIPRKKKDP
jgi:hypothetical protein